MPFFSSPFSSTYPGNQSASNIWNRDGKAVVGEARAAQRLGQRRLARLEVRNLDDRPHAWNYDPPFEHHRLALQSVQSERIDHVFNTGAGV